MAGSGKTTYARESERVGYVRLSIDEEVWARFGRFGVDYSVDRYAEFSAFAKVELARRLVELVGEGRDLVVDFRFWQGSTRDRYKGLVEAAGGQWRLVHLRAEPDVLRRRLSERSARFDANAAFRSARPC